MAHRPHNRAMSKSPHAHSETLARLRALGYNSAPRAKAVLRGRAQPVAQVLQHAPGLADLATRAQEGQARLQAIAALLPPGLRQSVQSGTVEAQTWNLLVPHAAAAAKLRQLLPALAAHLRSKGWPIQELRVKVRSTR